MSTVEPDFPESGRLPERTEDHVSVRSYLLPVLLAVVAIAIAVAITELIAYDRRLFGSMVRDPLTIARTGGILPYYAGWITHLGLVGWFAASTIGIFAGGFVARFGRPSTGWMLLTGGLATLVLGLDDGMMFHDAWLAEKGIREELTLAFLVVPTALWAIGFLRPLLRGPEVPLLVVAALLFGHSLLVEAIGNFLFHEEASKAGAIFGLAGWYFLRGWRALCETPQQPGRIAVARRAPAAAPVPTDPLLLTELPSSEQNSTAQNCTGGDPATVRQEPRTPVPPNPD